jgi:hypothetical protein
VSIISTLVNLRFLAPEGELCITLGHGDGWIGRTADAELQRIFPCTSEAKHNLARTSTNIPEYTAKEAHSSTFSSSILSEVSSAGTRAGVLCCGSVWVDLFK